MKFFIQVHTNNTFMVFLEHITLLVVTTKTAQLFQKKKLLKIKYLFNDCVVPHNIENPQIVVHDDKKQKAYRLSKTSKGSRDKNEANTSRTLIKEHYHFSCVYLSLH